jgi:hypothetical protein
MNKTICFYDIEATSVSRDADIISIGLVAVTRKEFRFTGNVENDKYEIQYKESIKTFYAEFNDYNIDKCDQWVRENVIGKLKYPHAKTNCVEVISDNRMNLEMTGETEMISGQLKEWLSQFESVKFWADYDVIDKSMLIDLIADWDTVETVIELQEAWGKSSYEGWAKGTVLAKIGLPKHLPNINYYDFYDLHTLFKIKGIDPDINREEFAHGYKESSYPCPEWLIGTGKHTALFDAYISYLCYENLMRL